MTTLFERTAIKIVATGLATPGTTVVIATVNEELAATSCRTREGGIVDLVRVARHLLNDAGKALDRDEFEMTADEITLRSQVWEALDCLPHFDAADAGEEASNA